jgi:hypothetical protein
MYRQLILALMFTILTQVVSAQAMGLLRDGSVSEVLAADRDYFERLTRDPLSIEPLLHERFIYLTHYQTVVSKPRLLQYLENSPNLVQRFELGARYVHAEGNTFLVWGYVRTEGDSEDFDTVNSRYWHVWERHASGWLLRTRQAALDE